MDCLFCNIANDLSNSKVIFEDDILVVIMDISPVCDGHLLIIPKKHYTTCFDLPSDVLFHMNEIAQKMVNLVMDKLHYTGAAILFNYGDKQVVKHVHMHIVPNFEKKPSKSIEEVHKILTGE